MHIQLQIVSKLILFVNFRGSNSAEGGTYQLADMYRRGPNPLADMDRGVHIRGESKSAVTPVWIYTQSNITNNNIYSYDMNLDVGSMSQNVISADILYLYSFYVVRFCNNEENLVWHIVPCS